MGKVNVEEQKKLLEALQQKLASNPLLWGMYYTPKHFSINSPYFHTEILRFCEKSKFLAVASPRESSKSTILTFLKPTHSIANKKKHFIIIVSNTYAKSAGALATIKDEFKNNQKLQQDFRVTFEKDSEGDTVFLHPDGFKTRVLCKGYEQMGSVRGEKFGPYRPDLIICDDLEDDIMVRSKDRRENLKDDFDSALIPAGDVKLCNYIVIGTILHDDSLMAKLVSKTEYIEFTKLFYRALIELNGKEMSLWNEKWTIADLHRIRAEKPSVFAKEYQNDPVSGAMRKFHKEDFRYWTIENNEAILFDNQGKITAKHPLNTCKAAIACDLAWEEKRESDFSVVVPAFLTPNTDLLIEDYICKKGLRPHEMEEILFTMETRLRALTGSSVPIGWEKAKLEKVMQYLLKQAMRKRNHYLIFQPLIWDTDKVQRIETRLEPRYAQHTVFHRQGMGELEFQLLRFPSGAHDDICLAEGTKIATLYGNKNIEDIKVGDCVITPFGIRKVLWQRLTGIKETINLDGLELTSNHKVFSNTSCFVSASMIYSIQELSRLKLKEVLIWKYKKLLSLMENNTDLWEGRKSIILVNQIQIREGKILKDFMWQFGNFITKWQFLKSVLFTIKMVTLLITTLITWSCYHIHNIINLKNLLKKRENIFLRLDLLQLFGINLQKAENGIENMLVFNGLIHLKTNSHALFVANYLYPQKKQQNVVHKVAETEKNGCLKRVYNLKVDKDQVFYANGILVSNCDAEQGLVQLLQYPKTVKKVVVDSDDQFQWLQEQARKLHKPSKERFVFGNRDNKRYEILAKVSWR